MLGTSFQKSIVARARLDTPSGVNSNFYNGVSIIQITAIRVGKHTL
jgi:hypothetical protein